MHIEINRNSFTWKMLTVEFYAPVYSDITVHSWMPLVTAPEPGIRGSVMKHGPVKHDSPLGWI